MAIIVNSAEPGACNYWHIRNLHYDKADNSTVVNLGGYRNHAEMVGAYPSAWRGRIIRLAGEHSRPSAYLAIMAMPEWVGSTSDEVEG